MPRYLELLSAGGSRSPEQLAEIVGIDLADPGFWDSGLALVEEQLTEAEAARRRRVAARRDASVLAPCACASAPPGARPR